jgi:hypothetical protein
VSGFLHLGNVCDDDPGSSASRELTPARDVYSFDLRKRAHALCNRAVNDVEVANTDAEDGGCDNSSDGGNHEEDYDDHGYEDPTTGRRNRRWEPLEEKQLLAWRREEKSWKWIFERFPDRTEGAVRVRFHMLQQRLAQKAD